jgi:hypothetical protein
MHCSKVSAAGGLHKGIPPNLAGLKEHPLMTHEHSMIIANINDEIRRQIGVHFPQDDN